MILTIEVDQQRYSLNVPEIVMQEGEEFFRKIDQDLDKGVQMSRKWVDQPDRLQRCQFAADKILTALHSDNEHLGLLMAGYILTRMPEVTSVRMDTEGDMLEHEMILGGDR